MLVGWKKGAGAEAAIEKGWNEDICGLCNTSIGGGFPGGGAGRGGAQFSPAHCITCVPPLGLRESRLKRRGWRRRKRPQDAYSTPMSSDARCVRTSRSRCRTASLLLKRAGASERRPRGGMSASKISRRKRLKS